MYHTKWQLSMGKRKPISCTDTEDVEEFFEQDQSARGGQARHRSTCLSQGRRTSPPQGRRASPHRQKTKNLSLPGAENAEEFLESTRLCPSHRLPAGIFSHSSSNFFSGRQVFPCSSEFDNVFRPGCGRFFTNEFCNPPAFGNSPLLNHLEHLLFGFFVDVDGDLVYCSSPHFG
jgi:hypothetical protein